MDIMVKNDFDSVNCNQKCVILSFILRGQFGKFTKNDSNKLLLTYQWPPKTVILGLLGAILGYGGLGSSLEKIEFYNKLKAVKIGIEPLSKTGSFIKFFHDFNNTTGASGEGTWKISEELLQEPIYRIYLDVSEIDEGTETKLIHYLSKGLTEYPLYLGRNCHFAEIEEFQVLEGVKVKEKAIINSIFFRESRISEGDQIFFKDLNYCYREFIPTAYGETGYDDFELFYFTKDKVLIDHLIVGKQRIFMF